MRLITLLECKVEGVKNNMIGGKSTDSDRVYK